MGIICKTDGRAKALYARLKEKKLLVYLVTAESQAFKQGIIICSAHMAKGLEFDHVIVPEATAENYAGDVDKAMLYVACTRAMHRLTLTHTDKLTQFAAT